MWDADSFLDRAQELVKKAFDEHSDYNAAQLDRSRPVKKGAVTRRRLSEQVAVKTHTMRTSFVGKVRDVRQIAEAQIGEGLADMVEFKALVNGHEATKKANGIQAWQGLSDWQLADRLDRDRSVLLLPGSLCGVGSTSQSLGVQDGGKSRHAERRESNVHSAGSSRNLTRTFTRCNWVEVASA